MNGLHVTLFLNATARFQPYKDNDLCVRVGEIDVPGPYTTDLNICEQVFTIMNQPDRPYSREAWSTSVGDVICISGDPRSGAYVHRYYACDRVGWRQIECPIEVIPPAGVTPFKVACDIAERTGPR